MNRIKELRQKSGMKQTDLAKLLSCAPTAVSKYELGQLDIGSSIINRLCDIFGCTSDYLLCRSSVLTPELSAEQENLLLAYSNAPPDIKNIVMVALNPYRQDIASIETA